LAVVPPLPKSFEDAARQALVVEAELERVCNSSHFRSSKRSCEFLKYVVRVALDGRTDSLKERSIGIDLFGRDTSYEPSSDATVRVRANEVRKRLSSYYADSPAVSPLRIDLPTGSYVPRFLPGTPRPISLPRPPLAAETQPDQAAPIPPIPILALMRPALLALVVCTLLLRHQLESREEYLRFWDRLLSGRSAMVLSIPDPDRASLAPSLYPVVWVAGRYGVNATLEGDSLAGSRQDTPASVQVSYATPHDLVTDTRLRWILSASKPGADPALSASAPAYLPAYLVDRSSPDRTSATPGPPTSSALLTILPEEYSALHVQGTDADSIRRLLEVLTSDRSFPGGLVDRLDARHVFQIRMQRDPSGQWRKDVFSGGA